LQCLTDFVDCQLNYYNNCTKILQDLSRQIGSAGIKSQIAPPLISNSISNTSDINTNLTNAVNGGNQTPQQKPMTFFSALNGGSDESIVHTGLLAKKQAKVLFDYEATDPSEISVSANQVR
jgi:hypothetical protein